MRQNRIILFKVRVNKINKKPVRKKRALCFDGKDLNRALMKGCRYWLAAMKLEELGPTLTIEVKHLR